MPADHILALLQEIADRLRAVALDEGEDLTSAERRELVEIALEVEGQTRDETGRPGADRSPESDRV